MIDGIILSHTQMGGKGFCTNILITEAGGKPRQIRPRLPPNGNLYISSFGFSPAFMNSNWLPGYLVQVDKFVEMDAEHRRSTHPEDVAVVMTDYWHPLHMQTKVSPQHFQRAIMPFMHANTTALFPPIIRKENGKAYVESSRVLLQSVGYVRTKSITFIQDDYRGNITERCMIVDMTGTSYNLPLKDTEMLRQIAAGHAKHDTLYAGPTVRLALAGAIPGTDQCYVMATHVIF